MEKNSEYETPDQADYFDYFVYGTEGENTASANYRPRNSATALRKPPKSGAKSSFKPQKRPSKEKSSEQKHLHPDDDSFKISPIYSDEQQ
jgi:hypothetical protein